MNSEEVKRKTRPLKLKKKIYEFYSAPITKGCAIPSDPSSIDTGTITVTNFLNAKLFFCSHSC
jgi:hypothetical protein